MLNLIPRFINQKCKEGEQTGSFDSTVMCVDISGFTAMTESLMQEGKEGAEVLSDLINRIYGPIINRVYKYGGYVTSFAGDAFTSIFPGDMGTEAYHAAQYIQDVFNRKDGMHKTVLGEYQLSARIGLSFGDTEWGILGEPGIRTFYYRGEPIIGSAAAISGVQSGNVVLDASFIDSFSQDGSFVIKPLRTEKRPPLGRVTPKIVKEFVPSQVIKYKMSGEFRHVVSIFISFKNVGDYDALNAQISSILTISRSYGGHFNGLFFDDKGPHALVVFGAPISYENNMERAIDFALTINTPKRDDLRFGITEGMAYAGMMGARRRGKYTVLGDSVNLAARFMGNAEWGNILVESGTASDYKTLYNFESIGDLTLKGKAKTIATSKVVSPKEQIGGEIFIGDMMGRKQELKLLRDYCSEVEQGKFGGVVYVYGDAGIGKSRLIYEFFKGVPDSVQTFALRTDDIQKKSLNPFIYALRNYFTYSDTLPIAQNRENFESIYESILTDLDKCAQSDNVVTIKAELVRVKPFIAALIGVRWDGSLYEEFDAKSRLDNTLIAIKNFFKAQSLIKPTIISLEDVQWLDDDSIPVFEFITRNVDDYPMIIVAASRYYDDGSKPTLELEDDVETRDIEIGNLSGTESNDFIDKLLGGKANQELISFITDRTEGNPFYLEQFCKYLKENDQIEQTEGVFNLRTKDFNIPRGIKAILIARIDRLSLALKELAQTASVLGREFEIRILSEMLKGKEITPILSQGEAEVVWSAMSEILYLFKHVLFRDAAYDMQLMKRLKELHLVAAEAIEGLYGEDEKYFIDMAYHYEKAEKVEKAVRYYLDAGEAASGRSAYFEGSRCYEGVLRLSDDYENMQKAFSSLTQVYHYMSRHDEAIAMANKGIKAGAKGDDLNKLIFRLARVYLNIGELDDGINCLEKIKKDTSKTEEMEANMLSFYAEAYRRTGKMDELEEAANKAIEISERIGFDDPIGPSLNELAIFHFYRHEVDESLEMFERASKMRAKMGDYTGEGVGIGNMGIVYRNNSQFDKAVERYDKQIGICKEIGDFTNELLACYNKANVYLDINELDKGLDSYLQVQVMCKETGDKNLLSLSLSGQAKVLHEKGRFKEALELNKEFLRMSEVKGDPIQISEALLYAGANHYGLGDWKQSVHNLNDALTKVDEIGVDNGKFEILEYLSLIAIYNEEYGKVDEYVAQLRDLAEESGDISAMSVHYSTEAGLKFAKGDTTGALELIDKWDTVSIETQVLKYIYAAKVLRARVYIAQKKWDEVEAILNECGEFYKLNEMAYDVGLVHLYASQLYQGKGDAALAKDKANKAKNTFSEIDAKYMLSLADKQLGNSG